MFKFDNYPQLLQFHSKYQKLVDCLYSLEIKIEKKGGNSTLKEKYNSLYLECKDFENEYEKAIFMALVLVKPQILNRRTKSYETWDAIFCNDFDAISSDIKGCLVCAVEESGGLYRFPPEFYV